MYFIISESLIYFSLLNFQSSNMNIRQINASTPSKRSTPTSTPRVTTPSNEVPQLEVDPVTVKTQFS